MNRSINNRPWTDDDDAVAAQMRAAGSSNAEIGERLSRSGDAVRNRFYLLLLRQKGAARYRARIPNRPPQAVPQVSAQSVHPIVPEHVWEARNARLTAPRSLTAMVFGDPAPGRSALDRRQST